MKTFEEHTWNNGLASLKSLVLPSLTVNQYKTYFFLKAETLFPKSNKTRIFLLQGRNEEEDEEKMYYLLARLVVSVYIEVWFTFIPSHPLEPCWELDRLWFVMYIFLIY